MTENQDKSRVARGLAWGAGLVAWLAARPRGRWATARGRWVQTVLTSGLVLAGLGAWALALVQPWTARRGDHGIVAVTDGVDTDRIRSVTDDVERLCASRVGPARPAPARNPFASPGAANERIQQAPRPAAAGQALRTIDAKTGETSPKTPEASAPVTAQAMLETVRSLRLEVTLINPASERWAVINGVNYREGDTVAGMEIVEIQDGRVKLRQAGMTCLLRMD